MDLGACCRSLCAIAAVLACGALNAAEVVLPRGETEVVLPAKAAASTRYAAEELTNFLSRVFSAPVPIVAEPTPGRASVILGDSAWSRRAGIDVGALPRDAFVIAAEGRQVLIAGRDDAALDIRRTIDNPRSGGWDLLHEHATLFGAYEFLERHAGVRMYFPGELGEVVPQAAAVRVPCGRFTSAPASPVRNYSVFADGAFVRGDRPGEVAAPTGGTIAPEKKINAYRNRVQTQLIPCCHGQNGFRVYRRFGESHPEYFAMMADGVRRNRLDMKYGGRPHLCHSSAVWDEFYRDIVSYAKGEPPTVRRMGSWKGPTVTNQSDWAIAVFRRPWVDVMPQDGFMPCECPACKAAWQTNRADYATALIWRRTVELANRLKADGIPMRITQMAYFPYSDVPEIDIPDNVDVMVARNGPWSYANPNNPNRARQIDDIRAWSRKLGRKIWMWTYPCKFGSLAMPDIPNCAPHAWGRFYADIAPYSMGAYAESNGDRFMTNYLNYWIFGKVMWDPSVDVDALLDEHYRLMFGPAAKAMKLFVEEVEKLWVERVAGNTVQSPMGPIGKSPSEYQLYWQIYDEKRLARWKRIFDLAAEHLKPGSIEARRVALYRAELLDPLVRRAEEYRRNTSVALEQAARAERPDRKNLFSNGDFAQGEKFWSFLQGDRYATLGKDYKPYVSFVKDAPEGISGSLRVKVDATDRNRIIRAIQYFGWSGGELKSGHRYRVSYFVKLDNVTPGKSRDAGVGINVSNAPQNLFLPLNRLSGTTGWIHQQHEFTASPGSEKLSSRVIFDFWDATGTAWFTGIRVEDVTP